MNKFKSNILKIAWNLGLGFICWQIWLERNNRIFKEEFRLEEMTYKIIARKLIETLYAKTQEDIVIEEKEIEIWTQLQK